MYGSDVRRSKNIPITVLVQTKNEEMAIESCVSTLRDFDEVIVVDSDSSDDTAKLAENCGATVVNFTWNGRYPKKKQWQLDNLKTRNNWVLFLDADETLEPALIEELRVLFSSGVVTVGAFDIRLRYTFSGRELRFGHYVIKRALVSRQRVSFPVFDDLDIPGMGELEGHYQPTVRGATGRLSGRILHNDPDPVRTWFDRHNKYSDWEANLRLSHASASAVGKNRSQQGRIFARLPFKPLVFFLYSYVLKLGILDGRAGLDYAIALSMYYWQIGVKYRELQRGASEIDARGHL